MRRTDLDDQTRRERGQQAADGEEVGASTGASSAPEDPSFFLRRDGESSLEYAARVFERIYTTDIEQLCSVKVRPHYSYPPSFL